MLDHGLFLALDHIPTVTVDTVAAWVVAIVIQVITGIMLDTVIHCQTLSSFSVEHQHRRVSITKRQVPLNFWVHEYRLLHHYNKWICYLLTGWPRCMLLTQLHLVQLWAPMHPLYIMTPTVRAQLCLSVQLGWVIVTGICPIPKWQSL